MRKFNLNEFFWFCIMFFLTYLIYHLIWSGNINLLISPNDKIYVIISFIAMIIITLFQFLKIFTNETRENIRLGYFIFIFVIMISYISFGKEMDISIADIKGIEKQGENIYNNTTNDIMVYGEENNWTNVVAIQNDYNEFCSKEVNLEGYIYEKDGEFYICRLVMSCCAADIKVHGIKIKTCDGLQNRKWVQISGIVENDGVEPCIKVNKIINVKKPKYDYLYKNHS